jgi:hypothetical protein
MAEKADQSRTHTPKAEEREARRAKALKENLRRRKGATAPPKDED